MLQLTSAALTLSQASECKVCFLCVHRGYERERERETEAGGEIGSKERKRARRGRDESFRARRPLNAFLRHLVSPQFRVLNSFNEDQFDHGRPLDLVDLLSGSPSTSSTSIVIVVAVGSILTGRSNTEERRTKRDLRLFMCVYDDWDSALLPFRVVLYQRLLFARSCFDI